MGFFDAPRPPPPQPPQPPRPEWMGPPEGWIGGFVPMRAVLARTGEVAVILGAMEAFPTGVRLELLVLSRQPSHASRYLMDEQQGVRFGVAFPDGSKWQGGRPWSRTPAPPMLMSQGGGGGDHEWQQQYWLWPLPPPGPVTFAVAWPEQGIPEATTQIDGAVFRAAAAEAIQLWQPLTPEEQAAAIRERLGSPGGRSGMMVAYAVSDDEKTGDE